MNLSTRKREAWGLALALAAAAAVGVVSLAPERGDRLVILALDSSDAARFSNRADYTLADFWSRAKVLGVSAAVLRQRPLSDLLEKGDILHFSAEELEKWKAVGLIAPSVALKANTLWIKSPRVLEQVLDAAATSGLSVTTSAFSGYRLVQFPDAAADFGLRSYDPDMVEAVAGRELAPVYAGAEGAENRGVVWLRWDADGSATGFSETAENARILVTGASGKPRGRAPGDAGLEGAQWEIGEPPGALLRAAYGGRQRLVVVRLSPSLDVEENFEALRERLRDLERRGLPLALPRQPPAPETPPAPGIRIVSALALWLAAALLPLWAMRISLLALRSARTFVHERWPIAAPVPQVAAGLLAAAAIAAPTGLLMRALGARSGFGDAWTAATWTAPLLIAFVSLFWRDFLYWFDQLGEPVSYRAALTWGLGVLALWFAADPRGAALRLGVASWMLRARDLVPVFWWASWRWREIFIGYPALLVALWALDADAEARPWLVLGLLGPVGTVAAVGAGGSPEGLSLLHTLYALGFGAAIGTVWAGLVHVLGPRCPGPPAPPIQG